MSAPWYDVAEPRPEAASELYHENSKRGRSDGIATPRAAIAPPDYGGLPILALADAAPSACRRGRPRSARDAGSIPLRAFSDLLAAGCRPLTEADPVEAFVCAPGRGDAAARPRLVRPAAHGLRLLRRGDAMAESSARSPRRKCSAAPAR